MRPKQEYLGMTETARLWVGSRQSSIARACGVTPTTTCDWYRGRKQPSYAHALRLLATCGGIFGLEDFGYVTLPDGRVARLLAEVAP